jgi:hypothetical protein
MKGEYVSLSRVHDTKEEQNREKGCLFPGLKRRFERESVSQSFQ